MKQYCPMPDRIKPSEQTIVLERFNNKFYFDTQSLECGLLTTDSKNILHRAKCAKDFEFPRVKLPARGHKLHTNMPLELRHVVINVTGRCNLHCQHCIMRGSPLGMPLTDMTIDTALETLRFAQDNRDKDQEIIISLYGGEPLLNPQLIHEIIDHYDEVLREPVGFWLCTNGTIFDEALLEKTIAHNGTILISLGFQKSTGEAPNEKLSESIPAQVQQNIERLLSRWPDRIAFVGSASGCQNLGLRYYKSLSKPIRERLTFRPWIPIDGETITNDDQISADALAFATAYKDRVRQRRLPAPVEGIALDEGFHRYFFRLFWKEKRPWHCGAAASEIAVAPDGSLFPCVFFAGCPSLAIGNVKSGLNHAVVDAFFSRVSQKISVHCKSCWARTLCEGGCPRWDYDLEGRWNPVHPDYCQNLRETISSAIALYIDASLNDSLLYVMGLR